MSCGCGRCPDHVLIPTVIESTNRGERADDIYSRMLANRIVAEMVEMRRLIVDILTEATGQQRADHVRHGP